MKAILFDLDDTLVASGHLERHRRTRDQQGLRDALPGLEAPESLHDVLRTLAARTPLGIVTTSPAWYARSVLAHLYPDIAWAVMVTYGDVRRPKPDPEGLLLALNQLAVGTPGDVAYVGDQDHDLEAARRAGLRPVRATWCGGVAGEDDERVLARPAELLTLMGAAPAPAPGALTRTLLTYAQLPGVGRKTLLTALPDLRAGRVPDHPRITAALARAGVWAEAEEAAHTILDACRQHDTALVSPLDAAYPEALRGMHGEQPALLYVRGTLSPAPGLTVIGTREPTRHGAEITRRVSRHFVELGYSVISGLALGIDTQAHEAALDAGGHTAAVLAHGLDSVTPRQNSALATRILTAGGALVSEYPPGTPARPPAFVERDRIQVGLARGTVVIQTDLTGGSWHACRATLRYGRPLAYPVPTAADATAPKAAGIHLLDTGSDEQRAHQLTCSPAQLALLVRLASREDYATLHGRLQAPEARHRTGAPTGLFDG